MVQPKYDISSRLTFPNKHYNLQSTEPTPTATHHLWCERSVGWTCVLMHYAVITICARKPYGRWVRNLWKVTGQGEDCKTFLSGSSCRHRSSQNVAISTQRMKDPLKNMQSLLAPHPTTGAVVVLLIKHIDLESGIRSHQFCLPWWCFSEDFPGCLGRTIWLACTHPTPNQMR